jgi:hypothetical protein
MKIISIPAVLPSDSHNLLCSMELVCNLACYSGKLPPFFRVEVSQDGKVAGCHLPQLAYIYPDEEVGSLSATCYNQTSWSHHAKTWM